MVFNFGNYTTMDQEKNRKKRRRSMRTLRRQSGALPISLLSLDDDSESTNIEGKLMDENQETFGSIWYESQVPMKDRRKRRSNIFATLPTQAIHENEEENTDTVNEEHMSVVSLADEEHTSVVSLADEEHTSVVSLADEEHTSVVSLADDYKTSDKVEKGCNEELVAKLSNKEFVRKVCNENSGLSEGGTPDRCIHTNSSPPSVTCDHNDDDKDNTLKNLVILENFNHWNSAVECHTPLLRDNKEHDSIQTPPEEYVSKVSPSSMSPDFPMSLSGAEYTTMVHNESYLVTGINSSNVSDLSLSDKENSSVANNSSVSEWTSHQSHKEYSENVSPGFLSVCKTFAGKMVSFVKTSPSYLTNALLNSSNNSDVSASPALKGNVNTPNDVRTIDSESGSDGIESSITNVQGLGSLNPCSSQNENVVPHSSSLMGSARKTRDKKSFFDTFSAISEVLMKDTESNKPVQQQDSNKPVQQQDSNKPVHQNDSNKPVHQYDSNNPVRQQDSNKAGEDKVLHEEEKESLQTCMNIDDLHESSNDVALPRCVAETRDITSRDENDKQMDVSLGPSVGINGHKIDDLQTLKEFLHDSNKEIGSGLSFSNATNMEENKDKTVDFNSSVQDQIDVCQMHTPEIDLHECCSTNKSSERKRKRRALDIAYVETSESTRVDYSSRKVEMCIPGVSENKLVHETTAELTSVELGVGAIAVIPDTCCQNSDIAPPILSLINVLPNNKKSECDLELNINTLEDGSSVKKGRRRAFGFSALEKQSQIKTGEEITEDPGKNAGPGKTGAQQRDDKYHKSDTLNCQGLSDNETSEQKVEHENLTYNNFNSKTLTLIENSEISDVKMMVQKQKKTRRRSGKFHFISQHKAVNETNKTDTFDNCAETECDRLTESEISVAPDSLSSARLISDDMNKDDINNSDDMNITPSVANEMPKKQGYRKSADVATLKMKENITEADVKIEVSVNNERIKKRDFQPLKTSKNATSTVTGYVSESNDTTKQSASVETSKPRKLGRPKSVKTASVINLEHGLESVENSRTKVDAGKIEPKKRGRRKSADAATLNIKKCGIVVRENIEIDDDTRVMTKRGRRKSADAASLNIKKCGIEERGNIELETDDTCGKTKRGRRKSADAASLNIKHFEERGNVELENDDAPGVQKKRGRRKSADAATLKLMILNEDDNVGVSEVKRCKKRKLETSEDIEMLYRNKNYIKPEEKKPWQTIVESPINQTQVYKKNRLQRFIDFEKPSQLKLRRRFQKATKNGWDPKKKKHCELNDEFVENKLARVWSELDESQTCDLRSKLQSIVETS